MDIIGGAASVSQLIAYSLSSARCLQQLYSELKNFGTAYRNEEANICLLLDVIKGLSDQGVDDSDPILPILLDISRLACEILHLIKPRRLLGINWTPLTRQDELKSSFTALEKKQRLLHLRVSGETLAALRTVSRQISNISLTDARRTNTSFVNSCYNDNETEGMQEVLSSHASVNEIEADGNKNNVSGADLLGIIHHQSACRSTVLDEVSHQLRPQDADTNDPHECARQIPEDEMGNESREASLARHVPKETAFVPITNPASSDTGPCSTAQSPGQEKSAGHISHLSKAKRKLQHKAKMLSRGSKTLTSRSPEKRRAARAEVWQTLKLNTNMYLTFRT